MSRVHVCTASKTYDVLIGYGVLDELGQVCRQTAGGEAAFVVSDSNVGPLYASRACASLSALSYDVACCEVPAGEQSKRMSTLADLLENIAAAGLTRGDVVVALGGGVIGDLAGFAAACYMRGCAVVQVPTSLLAMVDSSVGGKTAVDLAAGKNLSGAFWQPSAVIADVACLKTLSPSLFADSLGEVIKYGVLRDPELFASLEAVPLTATKAQFEQTGWLERVTQIICRCVEIKRDVVDADEREAGLRQTLNLGHTIGHAIEAESGFRLGHGSCVAAGLCCMARGCAARGLCTSRVARRIEAVVAAHGLPVGTDIPVSRLYQRSLADKKRHGDTINIVAVLDIGNVAVRKISLSDYRHLLELGCEC